MRRVVPALFILVTGALAAPADELVRSGLEALRAGRAAEAWSLFDRAVRLRPDDLSTRFWRAKAAVAGERWREALDDLTQIVRERPTSLPSWVELGRCYVALGDMAKARSALEQALSLEPGHREATRLLDSLPAAPAPPAGAPRRPAVGDRLAWETAGVRVDPRAVWAEGRQVHDYTFGAAPTDWEPAGGTWAISSRYACEPEWSFYGGHSRGICAIWNKRRYRGDLAVEAYVAFKHGLPWADNAWSYIPSDLNLTLHADRGDLGSGYSFIYSGENGAATEIRRGDRLLARTTEPDALIPSFSDHNPLFQADEQGRPFGDFHRRWWRLEARYHAGHLTFLVDGRTVIEAEDPAPRDAGQVAIWTIGSGMVIARVRIAYQEELRTAAPEVVVAAPGALPEG